jgi:chromosome partitioning protein
MFTAALMERTAFREMHLTGRTPRQTDPKSSATANVAAITTELLDNLQALAKAA